MAIKRSKNKDDRPVFNDIIDDVEQEVKATLALANADSCLKYAIEQYQKASKALDDAVAEIGGKVESINHHIDNTMADAPNKLRVKIRVDAYDMQNVENIYTNHIKRLNALMLNHFQEITSMFADERRKVEQRYKEYDGCYLGHYIQWVFWFFFSFGLGGFLAIVVNWLGNHYGWFK